MFPRASFLSHVGSYIECVSIFIRPFGITWEVSKFFELMSNELSILKLLGKKSYHYGRLVFWFFFFF